MKTIGEGKNAYHYSNSRAAYSTNTLRKGAKKYSGTGSPYGGLSGLQGYIPQQMAYGNMTPSLNVPMMGGANMSPYQSMPMGQMLMPGGGMGVSQAPQYIMQMPQGQNMMAGSQMFQPPIGGLGSLGASSMPLTSSTFPSFAKTSDLASQQLGAWSQYPNMGYTAQQQAPMPTYTSGGQGSFIVNYSDGLNILDEPTGGTNYMNKGF